MERDRYVSAPSEQDWSLLRSALDQRDDAEQRYAYSERRLARANRQLWVLGCVILGLCIVLMIVVSD